MLRCWQSLENLPKALRNPYLIEAFYMAGRLYHSMGEYELSAKNYDDCLTIGNDGG